MRQIDKAYKQLLIVNYWVPFGSPYRGPVVGPYSRPFKYLNHSMPGIIWRCFFDRLLNCVTIPAQKPDAVWQRRCSFARCSLTEITVYRSIMVLDDRDQASGCCQKVLEITMGDYNFRLWCGNFVIVGLVDFVRLMRLNYTHYLSERRKYTKVPLILKISAEAS